MASSILRILWNLRFQKEKKIFFYSQNELVSSWTYSQILKLALDYSDAMSKWEKQKPVAITISTGPDFLGAFFGCQLAVLIPVPFQSPETLLMQRAKNDLQEFLRKSKIEKIITSHKEFLQNSSELEFILTEEVLPSKRSIENLNFDQLSEQFSIQYSSGSTSDPKGVVLTHSAVMKNLEQMSLALKVTQADRLSSWLPLFHDMGLIGGLMAPIYNQVEAHLTSPLDFVTNPMRWLESVSETQTTILIGPDFMYWKLAQANTKSALKGSLESLRVCMSGSEPVLKETCESFISAFKNNKIKPDVMLPVYGMAEAVLGVTFPQTSTPIRISRLNHVSCGRPLSGTQIEIRDEHGKLQSEFQEGQIFLSGPHITQKIIGHLNRSPNEFLATGDLGYFADGDLYITGRLKDVIIIRGKKIHNLDLENKIQNLLSLNSRVGVVEFENRIIVAAETDQIPDASSELLVQNYIQSIDSNLKLEFYYLPKGFLPRTSSGKLKRHQILELYKSGKLKVSVVSLFKFKFQSKLKKLLILKLVKTLKSKKPSDFDPVIDLITTQIQKLKPNLRVHLDQTIEELGLDSVQTLELITEIEKTTGPISLITFYEFKTVADIHRFLSSRL
jgi:acyl-CoA synthetase (AMP-forming)/AMP-acid ligase II/acyl carrier protein